MQLRIEPEARMRLSPPLALAPTHLDVQVGVIVPQQKPETVCRFLTNYVEVLGQAVYRRT